MFPNLVFLEDDLYYCAQIMKRQREEVQEEILSPLRSLSLFYQVEEEIPAHMDTASLLFIDDWKLQLLNTFYYWRSPLEIEAFLQEHPSLVPVLLSLLSSHRILFGKNSEMVLQVLSFDGERFLSLELYTYLLVEEAGEALLLFHDSLSELAPQQRQLLLLDLKMLG